MAENTVSGIGINQEDLVDLLVLIHTNYAALLAKLDADTVVAATDYVATAGVAFPSYIQTIGPKCIRNMGDVYGLIQNLIVGFNVVLGKVDADAGAGIDDDYASTLLLTNATGLQASDGVNALNSGSAHQGSMVQLLKNFITNFNLLLTKLDTDPLTGSDYSALHAIPDTVDAQACEIRPLSHGGY